MTNAPVTVSNPFPAEAVATYGTTSAVVTCTDLEYMLALQVELSGYLRAYSLDADRYGAAFGLRGGHGSGKTHVLGWLSDSMRGARSITGRALYGKCDSSKLFELYHQLMEQFDRQALIELVQLALLNLARAKVKSAKFTESLAEKLQTVNGLQALQADHNIDVEQLRQQLMADLQASTGANEVARLLLDVPDAMLGADAYHWLAGNEVDDLDRLGLAHQLRTLPREGVVDADTAAITALATIAALHRVAGVPLLILVDQLEVLLRTPDAATFVTLGSLLKKFVEQVSSQSAIVFIAGIPDAWDRLPRDVPARFRRREQIVVGSLTLKETELFLDAYTGEKPGLSGFSEEAVIAIRELSGGNPREVLRIAHHAFERTKGKLADADKAALLKSARRSGSISDRATLALTMVDAISPAFGALSKELAVQGDLVDRAILNDSGEVVVALLIVKATDPLDEIDSARRVHSVRRFCEEHWVQADLLVVSVGYSSEEVNQILGASVPPIVFREKTFEAELRTWLLTATQKPKAETAPDVRLAESLNRISERLAQLEKMRGEESARIAERFAQNTQVLAAPFVEERRFSTRREVLDALDALRERFMRGEAEQERKLLQSILVANEAYLHSARLEEYGDLYLESLTLQRLEVGYPAVGARDFLIDRMRDSLQPGRGLQALLQRSRLFGIALLGLTGGFLLTGVLSTSREKFDYPSLLPPAHDFVSMLPYVFMLLTVLVAAAYLGALTIDWQQRRRYQRTLLELRDEVREQSKIRGPTLRERYPQA